MVDRPPLLVIAGPTGVGKTAVAVRLARALPIEVVSADSRQVYRGMDIGTGKPTIEEQAAVRHHLLDVLDPDARYHAARFRADAAAAIAGIRARGRLPVVVGGTGLYVRALLKGLDPAPPANPELREALDDYARARGTEALHARLSSLDPVAAARLHPNDRVRVVRAIEVHARTQAIAREPGSAVEASWRAGVGDWHLLMVGLRQERAALNRRIAERARQMIAGGMMDEVRRLLALGYDDSVPGMQGIGYRQLCDVARGRRELEEALRLMIRDTTRYAKRQMTWFARDPELSWIDLEEAGGVEGAAAIIAQQAHEEGLIE